MQIRCNQQRHLSREQMMILSVLGRNDSKEFVPLRSHQDRWGWLCGLFRPRQGFAQALAF
jgi:hypothetical protein